MPIFFKMGRIIAIDCGRKRTGVAVTDILQLVPNALETVPTGEIVNFLRSYFSKEEVELIVVGMPKRLNNEPSEGMQFVNEFLSRCKKNFPDKELFLMDERFTSKMAFQAMIDGGLNKKKRADKAMVDKLSAVILLQSYLEYKANSSI